MYIKINVLVKKLSFVLLSLGFVLTITHGQNDTVISTYVKEEAKTRQLDESIIQSKQYQRHDWYLQSRRNSDGTVPNIEKKNYEALINYERQHPLGSRSAHGSWSFLGMSSTVQGSKQGRVNSIDIHPIINDVIYVCTPNGGIWHTTNGGFTWAAITDHLGLLSFADLEINPINPDILYAVSGDGDPAPSPTNFHGQSEVWSAGIFKSTDAGGTWSKVAYDFTEPIVPHKLLMHPTNPNIQYLAAKSGLFRTSDAWNSNVVKLTNELTYDIEFQPTDPSIVYLGSDNKIFVWDDDLSTLRQAQNPNFTMIDTASRIEIAVTPDFPNYVVAMAGNWSSGSIGIFTSDFRGDDNTWILRSSTSNVIGAFASYCIGLGIDPTDYKTYYGGGVRTHKSTNEGADGSWSEIGIGLIHADIHDIAFRANRIYVASDGGLFRSTDGGSSWLDLSDGLQISEIYRMSGSETNSDLYYIGTQDNGTLQRNGSTTFDHVLGGDGMESIIDYTDDDIVYATQQNGSLFKSDNGGSSFNWIPTDGSGAWITPILQDPSVASRIFIGKDSIFRSNSGGASGSWQLIGSPSLPASLNNLAQGTSNRNKMFASAGFNLYRSNNVLANPASSVTWTALGGGLPNQFITDIAVNPTNSNHVIVTMGGYVSGVKVYESTNNGDDFSWTNISGSLPDVPVLSIAYHDDGSGLDKMYIGTDIGVFYRDDNVGDWIYYSNFMPAVPVTDLFINTSSNTLTAATYGRGLWRSNLAAPCPNNRVYSAGVTSTGRVHTSVNQIINSAATISGQPGTEIYYRAGVIINLLPGFIAEESALFEAEIGPCPN